MTVQIPDTQARALMAQLPNTPEAEELKARIIENLDRSRTLTADELDVVLAVLLEKPVHNLAAVKAFLSNSAMPTEIVVALFRSAIGKLQTLRGLQLAREHGRGR